MKLKHFFYETASRNEFRFSTKYIEMTKKNEASTKRLILNMDWFGMSKADIIYEWLKTSAAILCRLPLPSPPRRIKANKRNCKSILISTKLRNEYTCVQMDGFRPRALGHKISRNSLDFNEMVPKFSLQINKTKEIKLMFMHGKKWFKKKSIE